MAKVRSPLHTPLWSNDWQGWLAIAVILFLAYLVAPASVRDAIHGHARQQAEVTEFNGLAGNYGE